MMPIDDLCKEVSAHPLEALFLNAGYLPSSGIAHLDFNVPGADTGVMESDAWFWVVIVYRRGGVSSHLRVEKCRPYTWTGDVGEGPCTCYGWTDEAGNLTSNYFQGSTPDDHQQAVLFKGI